MLVITRALLRLVPDLGIVRSTCFADGTMVIHFLGLLPTVSEDSGARNAWWTILKRVIPHIHARSSEMPADQQASLLASLADGSNLLMDDLDDHRDDDEHEDEERTSSAVSDLGRQIKLATVSSANQFMS